MRKSEPLLDGVIEKSQPLERTLKLRELQTSYVYTTVLAKKCRVRALCTMILTRHRLFPYPILKCTQIRVPHQSV